MTEAPLTINPYDPAQLAALIPHRMGFTPENSVVFFCVRPDGSPGLVARVDIRDASRPDAFDRLAEHLGPEVGETGRLFVLFYSPEPPPCELVEQWGDADLMVLVTPTHYGLLDSLDDLRPLGDLRDTVVAASFALHGSAPATSRTDRLPKVPKVTQRARVAVANRLPLWHEENGKGGVETLWEQVLFEDRKADDSFIFAAGLLASLHYVKVRDDLLAMTALGEVATADCIDLVFSKMGPAPDREVTRRAIDALAHLVAVAPSEAEASDAWIVMAWVAWFEGDGARADLCLDAATHMNRLGSLVRRAVEAGVPPGWARRDHVSESDTP